MGILQWYYKRQWVKWENKIDQIREAWTLVDYTNHDTIYERVYLGKMEEDAVEQRNYYREKVKNYEATKKWGTL